MGVSKGSSNLTCTQCHARGDNPDRWIMNNEYTVWNEQGRHRQAYQSLLGERSRRMGQVLDWKEIHKDPRCLACHATVPAEWMAGPSGGALHDLLMKDNSAASLLVDGVSCEACHGASGEVKGPNGKTILGGWQLDHFPAARWQAKSTAKKQTEFGFYDIRSPSSRTAMCASCHIGDPERGRLVTHAMYAAGHPPLPAFEVETFMRDMPPHWRILNTEGPKDNRKDALQYKAADVTEDFFKATEDAYYKGLSPDNQQPAEFNSSFDRTRSLAVGALVTWAHSAKVVAALASEKDHPLIPATDRWPELAAFDVRGMPPRSEGRRLAGPAQSAYDARQADAARLVLAAVRGGRQLAC